MQVLKIKHIPNIFRCVCDELNTFVLSNHNSFIRLYHFDTKTFEQIEQWDLIYKPVLSSNISIDEDCLYLPTADGRILQIDKFSGDLISDIDIGMTIPSGYLITTGDDIYCSVGIPVNNTLVRETINTYCFIKCNKQTKRKEIQSQRFESISSVIEKDGFYFCDNISLLKINKNLELELKTKLHFPSRQIIDWNDRIISISENGAIESFDKDLRFCKNIMTGKITSDVCQNLNHLLIPCGRSLVVINKDLDIKDIYSIAIDPVYFCDHFWICENGEIISYKNNSIISEKIFETKFRCIKTNNLFIGWTNKELIQCSL